MIRRVIIMASLAIAFGSASAQAQTAGAIELGLDGGVHGALYEEPTDGFVIVSFPVPILRAGFFLSDQLEIEPSIGYQRLKIERETPPGYFPFEDEVVQSGRGALGLAIHGGATDGSRLYAKASGFVLFAGDEDVESQYGAEAAIGYKTRLAARWAARFELSLGRLFENDPYLAAWTPSLTVGFSHFSR